MPVNTITKTKTGYRYRRDKYDIKSKQGETRKEFALRCDEIDSLIDARGTGGASMTLDQLFARWMEDYVKINLSPGESRVTIPIYEAYVKPYHGDRQVTDITRSDVYTRLSEVVKTNDSVSRSLISKIRGCYSRPYNWACNTLGLNLDVPTHGLIFTPPARKSAENEAQELNQRYISDDEMEAFLDIAIQTQYYNYYRIIYHTGLRPSECLGLQIRDIKPDRIEIRRAITKDQHSMCKTSKAIRDIPMTDEMREALNDQMDKIAFVTKEGWLFPTSEGKPNMQALDSAFRRSARRSGLNASLYDFRHTFATRMVERKMPPTILQHIMGHEDIVTTLKYYPTMTDKLFEEARIYMGNGKNTGNVKQA